MAGSMPLFRSAVPMLTLRCNGVLNLVERTDALAYEVRVAGVHFAAEIKCQVGNLFFDAVKVCIFAFEMAL